MARLGWIPSAASGQRADLVLMEFAQFKEMGFGFPDNAGTAMNSTTTLKRAGVKRLRFHDLRHTSAALMLNSGIDIFCGI